MSDKQNPAEPTSNKEKFKPANVSDAPHDKGRKEQNMEDVARGSEGDRRRASQNRPPEGR